MKIVNIDFSRLRGALRDLPSDHDADGDHAPSPQEIFAPEQHANALDPYSTIVVGARGTGKSFWAGVLNHDHTRIVAGEFYPNLGLDSLIVTPGYTSLNQKKFIDALVPAGRENELGYTFWQSLIIQSVHKKLNPTAPSKKLSDIMQNFNDPEDVDIYFSDLEKTLKGLNKTILVTFDALDTISKQWGRSGLLLDALFEAIWSLRAYKNIKAKVFIRPEQLNDDSLRFVELPKLKSARVELEWTQEELYGLLFSRLAYESQSPDFLSLCNQLGIGRPNSNSTKAKRSWMLLFDSGLQQNVMSVIAGPYMGSNPKKGKTYDWPYRHLSDAYGNVTPRSFIKLFVEAAKFVHVNQTQVVTAEGIRHGLREASKVRVDQLGVEYVWVRRALAPLAGLRVPCDISELITRWQDTNTVRVILNASKDEETGFLPPFPPTTKLDKNTALLEAMAKIGLIEYRYDGRIDIPDLFRVAALMLKKGGLAPSKK
ncbi:TPA: hypothetical protein R7J68_002040 [Klebsiella pneumoniae]|nr:hypothetical protein [Klebsiella pneumoniae]